MITAIFAALQAAVAFALTIFTAAISFATWFLKWLVADIVDAFNAPQKAVVRVVFGLAILALGVTLGIRHDARKVESARQEMRIASKERDVARAENAQWRERYAEQESKAKQAEVARAEAEARVRAAAAKRMRQPSPGAAPGAAKKP